MPTSLHLDLDDTDDIGFVRVVRPDAYGGSVMRAAVDDMNAHELVDIGALAVLCEHHKIAS
jgi:hypothetical protein